MEINKIYNENCLDTMSKMKDDFIQSIITSPPYFNLRDYGNKNQIGIPDRFKIMMIDNGWICRSDIIWTTG